MTTPAQSVRTDHRYELGRFSFDSGAELPGAFLAHATYGTLNEARDNVIVAPTWFSGTPQAFEWLIGPGQPLDTDRYFVVAPSMFGNGLSSSPSNTPAPFDRSRFPRHTLADNVRAQHELLVDELGITGIELVFGGSMGGMQAYQWAVQYPELTRRIFVTCGASRITDHCSLFLSGAAAALRADATFADGEYDAPPAAGLRAVARVWAPWSPSARWYRDREYAKLGFETVEQFVSQFWEPWYGALDANNFLSQLWTWQNADISAGERFGGDLSAALSSIRAKAVIAPSERDPYFPAEDAAWEAGQIPDSELRVIPGTWGHFALFGVDPASGDFIRAAIRTLLGHEGNT